MCGVSGYTGLGHLSAELRFDLVEAMGSGIDSRGGHAAGCVTVPEEGQPRLMRKLGRWDSARGRFIRAASQGHSVMMHSRFATHGSKDNIDNAHPFAVKRKDSEGKEFTVLYGCHNGVIYNAETVAKQNGRTFTVDSLEFFELLADKAYETIKALTGYGVVTWIRPEDRKVRLLRLSNHSDIKVYRLDGGGLVWGSTESIVKDALSYVGLDDAMTEIAPIAIGRVYVLSGQEAKETKLDDLRVNAGVVDRRTSGGLYCGWDDWEDYQPGSTSSGHGIRRWDSKTGRWNDYTPAWDEACWVCGEFKDHTKNCNSSGGYCGRVIEKETIRHNRAKFEALIKDDKPSSGQKADIPKPPSTKRTGTKAAITPNYTDGMSTLGKRFLECDDNTFRAVDSEGKVVPYGLPIYVREETKEGAATGAYVLARTMTEAAKLSGHYIELLPTVKTYGGMGSRELLNSEQSIAWSKRLASGRKLYEKGKKTATKTLSEVVSPPPEGHNGHWSIPQGISKEEEEEWLALHKASPRLAEAMMADNENDLAVAIDEELTHTLGKEGE